MMNGCVCCIRIGLAQLMAACSSRTDGRDETLISFSRVTTTTPVPGEARVDEVLNKTDDPVARRFELAVGDRAASPETATADLQRSTTPTSSKFQVFSDAI